MSSPSPPRKIKWSYLHWQSTRHYTVAAAKEKETGDARVAAEAKKEEALAAPHSMQIYSELCGAHHTACAKEEAHTRLESSSRSRGVQNP